MANSTPQIANGVHEFVFPIAADSKRGYPSGDLVFTIDYEDPPRVRVTAMTMFLGGRTSTNTVSESFDGACVVARRDVESNALQGLQILHYASGPAFVPELMAEVMETSDRFLLDAVATGMVLWALLEKSCEVVRTAIADMDKQAWIRQGSPANSTAPFWTLAAA